MAEIEHFVDPRCKDHLKFSKVENLAILLYSACNQMDGQPACLTALGEAVKKVTISKPRQKCCLDSQN